MDRLSPSSPRSQEQVPLTVNSDSVLIPTQPKNPLSKPFVTSTAAKVAGIAFTYLLLQLIRKEPVNENGNFTDNSIDNSTGNFTCNTSIGWTATGLLLPLLGLLFAHSLMGHLFDSYEISLLEGMYNAPSQEFPETPATVNSLGVADLGSNWIGSAPATPYQPPRPKRK